MTTTTLNKHVIVSQAIVAYRYKLERLWLPKQVRLVQSSLKSHFVRGLQRAQEIWMFKFFKPPKTTKSIKATKYDKKTSKRLKSVTLTLCRCCWLKSFYTLFKWAYHFKVYENHLERMGYMKRARNAVSNIWPSCVILTISQNNLLMPYAYLLITLKIWAKFH